MATVINTAGNIEFTLAIKQYLPPMGMVTINQIGMGSAKGLAVFDFLLTENGVSIFEDELIVIREVLDEWSANLIRLAFGEDERAEWDDIQCPQTVMSASQIEGGLYAFDVGIAEAWLERGRGEKLYGDEEETERLVVSGSALLAFANALAREVDTAEVKPYPH